MPPRLLLLDIDDPSSEGGLLPPSVMGEDERGDEKLLRASWSGFVLIPIPWIPMAPIPELVLVLVLLLFVRGLSL